MLIAITHQVDPSITNGERTYVQYEEVNYPKALEQHAAYCAALQDSGADVIVVNVNASPDSCFVEDTAIVLDEVAIITNMGVASRRLEPTGMATVLSKYRDLIRIESPATIEGGDVCKAGKRLYVGMSARTNPQGAKALAHALEPWGYEVVAVELHDCLHLKSAITALDDQTLLINPHWVDKNVFSSYNIIEIDPIEPWAANSIRVGETIFLQQGFERTLEKVRSIAPNTQSLDISEFNKVEAALSCLSLIFTQSPNRA
jgi:dimethylargininase